MLESSTGIINQAEMFPSVIFHFSDGIETIISAKTTLHCGLPKKVAHIEKLTGYSTKQYSSGFLRRLYNLTKPSG